MNIKPWMHDNEIAMIEKYLSANKNMLEWGSGGSTVYFAPKVKQLFSIEHVKEWFDKISKIIPANVNLNYVAANNEVSITESSFNDYADYINYAKTFDTVFDVVLIDGRARVECAKFILDFIHRDSVVIIHDFYKKNRNRYRKVLEYYDIIEKIDNTVQGVVVLSPKAKLKRPLTDLKEIIGRARKFNQPLSVLRFGDGEYYAATSPGSTDFMNGVPFIKHLGFIPSEIHKREISENIIRACKDADVVCVNENNTPKWLAAKNYFLDIKQRPYYYTADFHSYWLHSNYYDELFQQFDKVLLITGHNLADKLKNKYPHLQQVQQLTIPKQPRYFKVDKIHYPEEFKKTMDKIETMDLTGTLCLAGAGFIGKPYIIKCAKRGGIALDIGSVFDQWAGFATRGKGKGFEKESLKYAL